VFLDGQQFIQENLEKSNNLVWTPFLLTLVQKNKKEVEAMGVHVGCVITYPDKFHVLNNDKFVCRAIDNRAGGFMIAEVARLLSENKKKTSIWFICN